MPTSTAIDIDQALMPALQNVTVLTPYLRQLDYDSYSKLMLRQAPPLPAVPQPDNGHSLAFYILEGVRLLPSTQISVQPAQLPAQVISACPSVRAPQSESHKLKARQAHHCALL